MVTSQSKTIPEVYQGHFGEFTITEGDRRGVIVYRAGLALAAIAFAIGTYLLLAIGATPAVLAALTPLFGIFSFGLAVSLLTIHIYLLPLHRLLQIFWAIGSIVAAVLVATIDRPLALFVYYHPVSLLGIGFSFAALAGIYFKEAFCFNRLETKLLTPVVPLLLIGHLTGVLPVAAEKILLLVWSILFLVFVARKAVQPIPPDIGDKSVFAHLKQRSEL